MRTAVLGISCYFHDAAAALVVDGEIVFAAQEERYARVKNDASWPRHAILHALRWGRLSRADIDLVVYYEDPRLKFSRVLDLYLQRAPRGFRDFSAMLQRWTGRNLRIESTIRRAMGEAFRGGVVLAGHHASHAASAFFPSPFQRAAILTLDAVGEWSTSAVGVGRDNGVQLLYEQRFPHSIGMLYSAFTHFLGFDVNEGEYKVMGLAPYGEPVYADLIKRHLVTIDHTGAVRLAMRYFDFVRSSRMTNRRFHELFGIAPRSPRDPIEPIHMDIAASIQRVSEEAILASARYAHEVTGEKDLVMAGGVALNCVANGRIQREGPFERVWVQPAAGDAGGALGAALLGWHHVLGRPREADPQDSQHGSWLGDRYSADECRALLHGMGAVFQEIEDEAALVDHVARLLATGKIVGWFQGRMEYGPRALGARSILADPRPLGMQSRINQSIKFRESFRPFAPAVMRDEAASYFELPAAAGDSPYMLFTYPLEDRWRTPLDAAAKQKMASPDLLDRLGLERSRLPAVTHVDYSARIQTVDARRHGRYHRLLARFFELTGCPVLVNTSFNVARRPIVENPEDALHCFMTTDMDCLVVESCVLDKHAQPAGLLEHIREDY